MCVRREGCVRRREVCVRREGVCEGRCEEGRCV